MKKLTAICLLLALFSLGCTSQAKTGEISDNVTETVVSEDVLKEEIAIEFCPDYAAVNVSDLYALTDLVLRVTYNKDVGNYMPDNRIPVVKSEFSVKEVLKGEYLENTIIAEYYGGSVTLYDMLQTMSTKEIAAQNLDKYTEEEAKSIPVVLHHNLGASFQNDREYLIFLNYDERIDAYIISSDIYGAPEVDGDKVYNRAAGEYVEISSLSEIKE